MGRWERIGTGIGVFLSIVATLAAVLWASGAIHQAKNPALGEIVTSTYDDVYIPPGAELVPSYVNVIIEDRGLGGAGGVGLLQLGVYDENYPTVAERAGSANFLYIKERRGYDGEESCVILTYLTQPRGESRVRRFKAVGPSPPEGGSWGKYHLGTARIEDGTLTLQWGYSANITGVVVACIMIIISAWILIMMITAIVLNLTSPYRPYY